jgi:hypothetical protein
MRADMNRATRQVIHHPIEVPIEVQTMGTQARDYLPASTTGLAELVFELSYRINVGEVVLVSIPSVDDGARIYGKVIWLAKSACGYVIGMSFYSEDEAFRMRMIEQICHIEAYRKKKLSREGRKLSSEEAATEWISRYAASFPRALPMAA